jgi:hypothetical protein
VIRAAKGQGSVGSLSVGRSRSRSGDGALAGPGIAGLLDASCYSWKCHCSGCGDGVRR